MTDSWTEDDEEYREAKAELLEPPVAPPLQFHTPTGPKEYAAQLERREQLRKEELEHLTELRDRVREGIDKAEIDLASGTEMLLNISKARMALAGVGVYPAF